MNARLKAALEQLEGMTQPTWKAVDEVLDAYRALPKEGPCPSDREACRHGNVGGCAWCGIPEVRHGVPPQFTEADRAFLNRLARREILMRETPLETAQVHHAARAVLRNASVGGRRE